MEYRPIQKLSDEVIGQIAAGEVVERPASAVKELVENSIDAGATAVTVELKDGGISYIRVSDNGKGIPAGQVRMAFERHATSKLSSAAELFDVHTLGFRGEALASIAAVSKVSCTSRAHDAEYGVKAQVEGGAFVSITEAASPIGTTIIIKDLFYNAPVRLKFLKKPATEAALVSDYMMRLIFSRPDVAFRFVHQGKTVYRSPGDGTVESAIYAIYGRDALRAMRRVQGNSSGVLLEGFVGVGELARGNRMQQSFFINGRYFRDDFVSKALENGCEGFVMIGRFPSCVLFLQLPYSQVDVNVHPNKLEVRFQNPEAVASAVEQLTQSALRTVTMQEQLLSTPRPQIAENVPADVQVITLNSDAPAAESSAPTTAASTTVSTSDDTVDESMGTDSIMADQNPLAAHAAVPNFVVPPSKLSSLSLNEPVSFQQPQTWMNDEETDADYADDYTSASPMDTAGYSYDAALSSDIADTATTMSFSIHAHESAAMPDVDDLQITQEMMQQVDTRVPLRYIGAAFKTFLLFETGERLLMVDQHAAHERVLYDRFMARYEGVQLSQHLLAPQVLHFTAQDVALLGEMQDDLYAAGFEVEPFDATTVAVRAIPVILGQNDPVRDLLVDVLDEQHTSRAKPTRERLRRRVAQMACKHAIKAGDVLSSDDVRGLLEQMLETGAQPTCPHGRPIVSEMTKRDFEKRFKRIP